MPSGCPVQPGLDRDGTGAVSMWKHPLEEDTPPRWHGGVRSPSYAEPRGVTPLQPTQQTLEGLSGARKQQGSTRARGRNSRSHPVTQSP